MKPIFTDFSLNNICGHLLNQCFLCAIIFPHQMLLFISCAKTMTGRSRLQVPFTTIPRFETEARENAMEMSMFSSDELSRLLHVNSKIAAENCLRYQDFLSADTPPLSALLAYTGIVFKRIDAATFTSEDWAYAQEHLLITSFLYGLLRPLDLIKPYRLEGDVRLPKHGCTMFDYWKPILTDWFIEAIRKQGNTLVNLASAEMKDLLYWKRVEENVQVITPEFLVQKGGKPKSVTVYAKMCRGEMTRFLLMNRIEDTGQIKTFEWEGFTYRHELSSPQHPVFVLE